ncbi:innexin inx2-like [Neodiprion virginianus]|uniref:innexin inx2-like n=1 Tax=Neodiprion virginianus TaxID=2961670 RepID=UPI001EE73189|nr:innexin inx2-like [Neodiprion virginianus]
MTKYDRALPQSRDCFKVYGDQPSLIYCIVPLGRWVRLISRQYLVDPPQPPARDRRHALETRKMLDLFDSLKALLQEETARVDNIVFRLHSRATVILLSACAILVTAKQYIGEPISCITDGTIDKDSVNAYCWIYSTFTVSRHLTGIPGISVASPGVGQALEGDEIHQHRYYQWVCFVLVLQALMFYTPRALWGVWERGTVRLLSVNLDNPFYRDEWTKERRNQLVEYFAITNLHTHNFYAFRFLTCEILNFCNAIGQMYLLDVFLEGQFTKYGPAVTAFAIESRPFQRVDPMTRLFPKMTKCTIHTFGASGSPQTRDALCVLPLNVVNEKIFVFIWFWLVFLAAVSGLAVVYRMIVFSQPWARVYLLRATAQLIPRSQAETIVQTFDIGDWFLLHQLSHNINPIVFWELVNELASKFSGKLAKEKVESLEFI